MSYGIIYKITNAANNKEYVGQTTQNIEKRYKQHLVDKRNRHISNAIRKYGKENFTIELIATAKDQKELNDLEVLYVNKYNTIHPNGYNHRAGGNQNGICSEELRKKISNSKKGKPNLKKRGEARSEEYRIKISKSLNGKEIKATNINTGEVKIYKTAHSTKLDGHNPSNVVQICKKTTYRTHSKGWKFEYITSQDNQSGSSENKSFEHAQRLEIEPAKAE